MTAPRVSFASVLAQNMETLSAFYSQVFALKEVTSLRSELFRGLLVGDLVLGFSHADAAALLELPPERSHPGQQFLTFEAESAGAVGAHAERAVAAGATLAQAPHLTYYGADQAVLLDPEGNPFRVNHLAIEEVRSPP